MVVHVARDAVPVVQQGHDGAVPLRPSRDQGQAGLLREIAQGRHRLPGQAFCLLVPGDDEDTHVGVTGRKGEDRRRARSGRAGRRDHLLPPRRGLSGGRRGEKDRLACGPHVRPHRCHEPCAVAGRRRARAVRTHAGSYLEIALVTDDGHQACRGSAEGQSAASHEAQGGVLVPALQQELGDLGDGVRPLSLASAAVEQPRVLDRHTRRSGEGDEDRLVLLGEVASPLLLGHVQVAEDLIADPDGGAEKGVHLGVVRGEPVGVGVLGDVLEPTRLRVTDEESENAVAAGRMTDLRAFLCRHPAGDELDEPLPVAADDPERPVARVDECGGGLDDSAEHLGQVEVGAHGDDGVEKLAHPFLGEPRGPSAGSQLVHEVVEIQGPGSRP